jgi:hypothetical protein
VDTGSVIKKWHAASVNLPEYKSDERYDDFIVRERSLYSSQRFV